MRNPRRVVPGQPIRADDQNDLREEIQGYRIVGVGPGLGMRQTRGGVVVYLNQKPPEAIGGGTASIPSPQTHKALGHTQGTQDTGDANIWSAADEAAQDPVVYSGVEVYVMADLQYDQSGTHILAFRPRKLSFRKVIINGKVFHDLEAVGAEEALVTVTAVEACSS